MKLHVWDMHGQSSQKAVRDAYWHKADAIMIVFDLRDEESFLAVSDWKAAIDAHARKGIACMLVGNKCDAPPRARVSIHAGAPAPAASGQRMPSAHPWASLSTMGAPAGDLPASGSSCGAQARHDLLGDVRYHWRRRQSRLRSHRRASCREARRARCRH